MFFGNFHISDGKKFPDFAYKFYEACYQKLVCCCNIADWINHFAKI